MSVFSAAALSGCGLAAGFEVGPNLIGELGYQLGCDAEPADGVSFEGESVGVAIADGLACLLNNDVVRGKEFGEHASNEALQWGEPFRVLGLNSFGQLLRSISRRVGPTYVVIHIRQSCDIEAVVVRPLLVVGYSTIVGNIRAVIDLEAVGLIQYRLTEPIPLLLCPIVESGVAGISGQFGSEKEEAAVRGNVLVVVTVVEGKHLPSKTTIALFVPTVRLTVEYRLCHGGPRRSIVRRSREVELRSIHCRKGPEDLIVVSFTLTLI